MNAILNGIITWEHCLEDNSIKYIVLQSNQGLGVRVLESDRDDALYTSFYEFVKKGLIKQNLNVQKVDFNRRLINSSQYVLTMRFIKIGRIAD